MKLCHSPDLTPGCQCGPDLVDSAVPVGHHQNSCIHHTHSVACPPCLLYLHLHQLPYLWPHYPVQALQFCLRQHTHTHTHTPLINAWHTKILTDFISEDSCCQCSAVNLTSFTSHTLSKLTDHSLICWTPHSICLVAQLCRERVVGRGSGEKRETERERGRERGERKERHPSVMFSNTQW